MQRNKLSKAIFLSLLFLIVCVILVTITPLVFAHTVSDQTHQGNLIGNNITHDGDVEGDVIGNNIIIHGNVTGAIIGNSIEVHGDSGSVGIGNGNIVWGTVSNGIYGNYTAICNNSAGPIIGNFNVIWGSHTGANIGIGNQIKNAGGPGPCTRTSPPATPTSAPTSYTITGSVYVDQNGNGSKQPNESSYNAKPTILASSGTVTTNNDGTYTISNLASGSVRIYYTSIPSGYSMTHPRNGPPPTLQVMVGSSCEIGNAQGAKCHQGNITDVNFGINNAKAWIQSVCGDIRMDNGFTNIQPQGQSAIETNLSCINPGVVFTGDSNSSFGQGQPSSTNWVVGGTNYSEVYANPNIGGIFTSYDYLKTKSQASESPPIDLATICTSTNCNLPVNLTEGIYYANTDVSINAYTFPINRNYVFLINGNLTIRGDIITPVGSSSLFSTSENIIVAPPVGSTLSTITPNLAGIFSADKSFITQTTHSCSDLRLNVEGTIIVNAKRDGGSLQNNRDLCENNINTPALRITQRLDYILNLPEFLKIQSTLFKEVSP